MNILGLNKMQTAMFGAMLGDALGVPHEFKSDWKINEDFIEHPLTITNDYKTYDVPLGVYSDDFSQQLCVLDVYRHPHATAEDFYRHLLDWELGRYWVNHQKFDEGIQTANQLAYYRKKNEVNYHDPKKQGNGSLMRVLPLAFLAKDLIDLHAKVFQCSAITHNSPDTIKACMFYCMVARSMANHMEVTVEDRKERFDIGWQNAIDYLRWDIDTIHNKPDLGSGFVLDSLVAVQDCIRNSENYAEAVSRAIEYGGDTDTTACIVGGMAALVFGLESVSEEWMTFIQPSLQNEYVQQCFSL